MGILAEHLAAPGNRPQEPHEDFDEGCLPHAVFTEQPHDAAGTDGEIQVFVDGLPAEPVGEVFHFDDAVHALTVCLRGLLEFAGRRRGADWEEKDTEVLVPRPAPGKTSWPTLC